MNRFLRWLKFNLVGGIGIALQLALLALFAGPARLPYLLATVLAVEFTVLHNFAWHEYYTWRERRSPGATLPLRLARFHLGNGMVSMAGNLVIMHGLAGQLHVPLMVANGVAILTCSLVNFWISDSWVFHERAANASE